MSRKHLERTLDHALEQHRLGNLGEAARLYKQACQMAPSVFDPWYLAGALAVHAGQPAEAVELLTRALRLQPGSAKCNLFLGIALADLERYPAAERPLRSALAKLPAYPDAWVSLGKTLRALGRGDEALTCFQRALDLPPGDTISHEKIRELMHGTAPAALAPAGQ